MKTMLSGNTAFALFDSTSEKGQPTCRIHIYHKMRNEWAHDSILMVVKRQAGFEVSNVDIDHDMATVTLSKGLQQEQCLFERSPEGWVFKNYDKRNYRHVHMNEGRGLLGRLSAFFKAPTPVAGF
jgi:hypothetical protein